MTENPTVPTILHALWLQTSHARGYCPAELSGVPTGSPATPIALCAGIIAMPAHLG